MSETLWPLGRKSFLKGNVIMFSTVFARAAFGASAVLLSVVSTSATAQTRSQPARLSIGEIAARVEAQGYRDIEEIEREGSSYEVCAKDASGNEVELTVNAATGRVEKVEPCED